jgi:ferredoxin
MWCWSTPPAPRSDSLFREELAELADQFPNFRLAHWFTGEQGRMDFDSARQLDRCAPTGRNALPTPAAPKLPGRRRGAVGAAALPTAAPSHPAQKRPPAGGGPRKPHDRTLQHHLRAASGTTAAWSPLRPPTGRWRPTATHPFLDVGEDAGVLMPSGCRMGICHSCLTAPAVAGQVRDLRTGEVHGEPGQLIQTCVSAAAGPVNLEI